MKKLGCPNFFTPWLILSVALVLFSGPAHAYVYDHFTSPGINASLWVDTGPNTGLFSQPGDGYLYFNESSGGQYDRLRSFHQVKGAFTVLLRYSDFQAINTQPAGQGKSTYLGLVLADKSNAVTMEEAKNSTGQFFQGILNINGTSTSLNSLNAGNINSAWLGIRYNVVLGSGGKVDFLYNFGAGWQVLDSCASELLARLPGS